MTYRVVWEQVYGMLRQLALPGPRAFTAYMGDNTAIYGATCYLPDCIGHLYKCRSPPPSYIMQPGDRRLHWLPIWWMVHGGMRPRTSIARLVAPPTNYLVGGYYGALKSGRPSTRRHKKYILMMSCARPQP